MGRDLKDRHHWSTSNSPRRRSEAAFCAGSGSPSGCKPKSDGRLLRKNKASGNATAMMMNPRTAHEIRQLVTSTR